MKTKHTLAVLSVALWTMAASGFAAEEGEDPWRFGVTVPLWAAGIDGDVTVRGNTADVDISFDELKDHLDASFALGIEARRRQFGFYSGFGYMKFSADGSAAGGAEADAELKFLIADAGASYLLVDQGEKHPFVLEAIAGVRYWYIDTDLELRGPGGAVLLDDGQDRDLVDPIVGLRGSQYLTPKLHLDFQGDIGGFGWSDHTSDLDWSAAGLVSYDVARWCSLSAGYKAIGVDVERDSGASKKGVDIIMHGLLLTAKFKF